MTLDAKGFIERGRRAELEVLGGTWILRPQELLTLAESGRLVELLERPR